MLSRAFTALLALLIVLGAACSSGSGGNTGSAELVASTSSALSQANVGSLTVTITAPDIATPIVKSLVKTGGVWQGTIGGIPVGANRTFTGNAYDASNTLIYAGSASGVTITKGATALVTLVMQQVTPPPAYTEQVPIIDSLVASTSSPADSSPVTLTVTAHDATPGDTLTYAWTATGGSFSSTTATTTTWTSPATDGAQTITVQVTDAHQETATLSVTLPVAASNGTGSGQVTVTLNTWPVVSLVTASPTRIDVGQTTTLATSASDADGDPLTYAWVATCPGSFSSTTAQNPTFTLAAPLPPSGTCMLTVAVSDGRGGSDPGSVTVQTGPGTSPQTAPQVTSSFQSSQTTNGGDTLVFQVWASDPQGSALSWAWSADIGSAGAPTNGAGTSQIVWSAPSCVPSGTTPTITLVVSDALGLATAQTFTVTPTAQASCGTVVTSVSDSGPGSLRAAVAGVPSGGLITFAPALGGHTIVLLSPIAIATPLTLAGPGAASPVTISGNGTQQMLTTTVTGGVTISGMTFANGYSTTGGGAIYSNNTTLTIDRCVFLNNTSTGGGGALFLQNGPQNTITNSTFAGNTSSGSTWGGAIYNGGPLAVVGTTFLANSAGYEGGAIATFAVPTYASLIITNSTFTQNASPNGSAVFGDGTVLVNDTVTGNVGGPALDDQLYKEWGFQLKGTIVSNAAGDLMGPGTFISLGYNLIGNTTLLGNQGGGSFAAGVGDLVGVSPGLDPLGSYGGPTQTMRLQAGSPALDAIPVASCTDQGGNALVADQRGSPRPAGSACDIGAFERQPAD